MRRLKLCLSACLLGLAAPAVAAPHYKITTLAAFGAPSAANGVNSQGQVTGWAYSADQNSIYGVVWDHGVAQAMTPNNYGYLTAINEAGVSVGQVTDATSSSAAIIAGGAIASYDYTSPGYSAFNALNNVGGAVGQAMIDEQGLIFHATSLVDGNLVDLGALGGDISNATGINDSGLIAGWSEIIPGDSIAHAFSYDAGGMHDLGTMAGVYSAAYGLNNDGVIVGETTYSDAYPDATHAYTLKDGLWTDLGALAGGVNISSAAWAINDAGQVVGASAIVPADVSNLHATLWQDGQIYDLNDLIAPDSGWLLQGATAISSNGLIVGYGIHDGVQGAFLLQADGVPEPASWALLLAGFGAVGAGLRRARASGGRTARHA